MLKIFATFLLLLSFLAPVSAQNKKDEKKIQRAIQDYENHEYRRVIEQLKELYKEDKKAYTPVKYIANSYRKIHDYENAEVFFTLVVNSIYANAEDHLNYGQTLKANGKLAAAKEQFQKFSEKSQNSFLGNLMIQSFDQIEAWENEPKNFKSIARTGAALNSEHSEYGLVPFKDKYYITSNREINYTSPESFSWDGTAFTSIFEIDTAEIDKPDAEFIAVKGKINTEYHDGPLAINDSADLVIITRIDNQLRGKDFVNKMKLYEGVYEGAKWKEFKGLPFNSDDYSNGHASFGADDNTIYFVSDRPGGFGGMDIYMSKKQNGVWGGPQNLGPVINTSNNEVFPHFRNNKLYYSSDGFAGYGGLDILVSENKEGWQSPVNLKSPINSGRDDFGIYFISDSTGYYSSNREGGKGEDDIYNFHKSAEVQSVGIAGVFEYKGLPIEGTKILLKDNNDSLIAFRYTDEKGHFKFVNLAYQEDFLLEVVTEDKDVMDNGRLYLTNNDWDKIKLIERLKNGDFKFVALPYDEVEELELLTFNESNLFGSLKFAGKIYKKLPGDFNKQVLLYLVDDEGQVIDSVYSDKEGNFDFKKLGLDEGEEYFVVMNEEDTDLNLAFINEAGRYYQVAEGDSGKYTLGESIHSNADNGLTGVVARLEYEGKPLPFTKVDIYDSDNNLIATIFTNEGGEFQFNKLLVDTDYFFELPDVDDSTKFKSKLYVINSDGDPLYLINHLKDGRFSFVALPMDEYKNMQLLEESLVPELVELKGQVFEKEQGDTRKKIKVYLLDEDGSKIDSVYTDVLGNFNFERLDPDASYTFSVEDSDGLNLALLDDNNNIIEQAIVNDQGNFAYKKLTYQVANFEQLEIVDAELFEDALTHEISGQVFQKLPGDFESGMEVYIYNEAGDLIGTALTDEHGKFTFEKLNPDDKFYFRIEHHEEDFQLITLDDENNILNKIIKNELGHFKYHPLDLDHHKVLLEDAPDHHQILYFDEQKIELDEFTVYYRFDTVKINTKYKLKLNTFVELIKGQHFKVEVHSHTDNRGPMEYNRKLSRARTDEVIAYLVKQGFNENMIEGNYYGELTPAVDCETKDCDNDDHYLNRRTVLKLRKVGDF